MRDVLVTGGTGVLGRELVSRLLDRGFGVRVLSRRERPPLPPAVRAFRGNLAESAPPREALAGVDAVVHCASSPVRRVRATDVDGTRRLVEAAAASGSPRFVYISIVGVDRNPFSYYAAKLEAERIVEASGLPWTILRTTQFHELLVLGLAPLARLPVLLLPRGFRFQPIAAREAAERLAALVERPETGRVPDVGGPEVADLPDLARAYLRATGRRRLVATVPLPGRAAAAFRAGANLCPDRAVGRERWEDYLRRRFAAR